MPFQTSDSITAANANNFLRGLHRDNTDNSHTGDLLLTDLATFSITGGTITATGGIEVVAAGTVTGAAGAKTIRLVLGSTSLFSTGAITGTSDWFIHAWIFNTATSAQRVLIQASDHSATTDFRMDYLTAAEDTTIAQTIKTDVTLANAGDTVTNTLFDIFVVQIA